MRHILVFALILSFLVVVAPSVSVAEELAVDSIEHPTHYPHRHIRRRVRRRTPVRSVPAASPNQRDPRSGLYVGLGMMGNYFVGGGNDLSRVYEGGGGLNFLFGVRGHSGAIEFNFFGSAQATSSVDDSTDIRNGTLSGFTIDGKIFLMPQSTRIEPYVQFGLGGYELAEELSEGLSGFGLNAGGGVDVRLSPLLGIGIQLMYRGFRVDNSRNTWNAVPTEIAFLNTLSLGGNLHFHF